MVRFVRLTSDYVRDLEWYIAYPCDPRFSYHKAGEILDASDDEAADIIKDGLGTPSTEEEWLAG